MKTILSFSISILLFAYQGICGDNVVSVSGGYVLRVPPSAETTAAYMTISNSANQPIKIVGAESSAATALEFHEHIHQNGVMKMKRVMSLEVPANGSLELKPMGFHIMFIGLKKAFFKSKTVTLTFHFSDSKSQKVTLPVRDDEE